MTKTITLELTRSESLLLYTLSLACGAVGGFCLYAGYGDADHHKGCFLLVITLLSVLGPGTWFALSRWQRWRSIWEVRERRVLVVMFNCLAMLISFLAFALLFLWHSH
jgi:hypothetical protein